MVTYRVLIVVLATGLALVTGSLRCEFFRNEERDFLTGLSAASISQYLSGVTGTPKDTTLKKIADALDTSVDFLKGETPEADIKPDGSPAKKMTVEDAAKRLGKSEQFIRVSLQRGTAPFGFAVQMASGKWCYHISPKKFYEYAGCY